MLPSLPANLRLVWHFKVWTHTYVISLPSTTFPTSPCLSSLGRKVATADADVQAEVERLQKEYLARQSSVAALEGERTALAKAEYERKMADLSDQLEAARRQYMHKKDVVVQRQIQTAPPQRAKSLLW